MPNILRRPMFRKGGSTSGGTGITSGMEPRRNFGNGTDMKAMVEMADKLKSRYDITEGQRIGDFLTAFGATGGSEKPLTISQAIGQATAGYGALQAKRRAAQSAAEASIDAQLLKMFGDNKQELNTFLKTLKARAQNAVNNGQYKDFDTAYKDLFEKTYNDMYKRQRAGKSFVDLVTDKAKLIFASEELPSLALATRGAQVSVKIDQGDIKVPGGYVGYVKTSRSGQSDIIPVGDGKKAVPNKQKPGYSANTFDQNYQAGQNYIDVITQSVYRYEGKGTFTRVYP